MIDLWVESFEMNLRYNGTYSPAPWIAKMESYLDKYNALAEKWNKFIPKTRDNALKVQSFSRAASCFAWTGSSRFSSSGAPERLRIPLGFPLRQHVCRHTGCRRSPQSDGVPGPESDRDVGRSCTGRRSRIQSFLECCGSAVLLACL